MGTCLKSDAICCIGDCCREAGVGSGIKGDEFIQQGAHLRESGDKVAQFGASELAKIATFPGRCPVGT